jgi:hypothetical protein
MNRRKLLQSVTGLTLVILFVVGCGAPAATPEPTATFTLVPPTATPTPVPPTVTSTAIPPTATLKPEPPTATPTQAFTLATSAEEIVGTWHDPAGYTRFYEDGTFHAARVLDKLDSQPYAINEFRFEGTRMFIKEISVSGVPPCGDTTGIYEVRLLEGGKIQIVAIKDKCSPRRGEMATVYEPVR